jgi:hypothetical protein
MNFQRMYRDWPQQSQKKSTGRRDVPIRVAR